MIISVEALMKSHEERIDDQVEELTQCELVEEKALSELVEERALIIPVEALMKSHEKRIDDQVKERALSLMQQCAAHEQLACAGIGSLHCGYDGVPTDEFV